MEAARARAQDIEDGERAQHQSETQCAGISSDRPNKAEQQEGQTEIIKLRPKTSGARYFRLAWSMYALQARHQADPGEEIGQTARRRWPAACGAILRRRGASGTAQFPQALMRSSFSCWPARSKRSNRPRRGRRKRSGRRLTETSASSFNSCCLGEDIGGQDERRRLSGDREKPAPRRWRRSVPRTRPCRSMPVRWSSKILRMVT